MPGVKETEAGYANGSTASPTYEEVCSGKTGHAETVKVVFDPEELSLPFLLERYYSIIDPVFQSSHCRCFIFSWNHQIEHQTHIFA